MGIIYKLTSNTTGKSYIGSTVGSLVGRWVTHIYKRYKSNSPIYTAIRTLGKEDFSREILQEDVEEVNLSYEEGIWIGKCNTIEFGYNTPYSTFRPPLRSDIFKRTSAARLSRFRDLDIKLAILHDVTGLKPRIIVYLYCTTDKNTTPFEYACFSYLPSEKDIKDGILHCKEHQKAVDRAIEFAEQVADEVRTCFPRDCAYLRDNSKMPGVRQNEEPVKAASFYYNRNGKVNRIGVYFETETKFQMDYQHDRDHNMEKRFIGITKPSKGYDYYFQKALDYAQLHISFDKITNKIENHMELSKSKLLPHPVITITKTLKPKEIEEFRTRTGLDDEEVDRAIIVIAGKTEVSVFFETATRKKRSNRADIRDQMPRKKFRCDDKTRGAVKVKAREFALNFTEDIIDESDRIVIPIR